MNLNDIFIIVKISTIRKIAHALDVSLDYLIEDGTNTQENNPLLLEEGDKELLSQYHKLDEGDKGFIRGEIAMLLRNEKYQQVVNAG